MKELMIILFSAILVNNYPLSKFLGICPFLGVSKKLDSAVGMSAAVIFVMLMATAATWPIYDMLLEPNGLAYLQTIVFILVIAALVQLVETILKKYVPALYKALGVYLPLITTNCAVLGVTVLNITENYNFVESIHAGNGTVCRCPYPSGEYRCSQVFPGSAHHFAGRFAGICFVHRICRCS